MSDGTLQTLDVTMLDDVGTGANQLIQLDSNAKIPACSGAAITGLSSVTKNASDPTPSTNPSGGVGSVWQNTTSGNMFICTDATAGSNVWINIGAGSGNVQPWFFGGTQYGYIYGGNSGPATSYVLPIEKWSMTSDANSTNAGDMGIGCTYNHSCQRSSTYGYITGGHQGSPRINNIQKWQFSTDGDSTDVADLTIAAAAAAGSSSSTHCYTMAGGTGFNQIDKFPTASDANATDVGDTVNTGTQGGGFSSETYGYKAGGWGAPCLDMIQKVSFATDGNAVDVSNLTVARSGRTTSCTETHGYKGPGECSQSTIDKHNFASGANATDVGDGPNIGWGTGGCASSAASGYWTNGVLSSNAINKYSHTTDGNATDIADIVTTRNESGGCHN